MEPELPADGIAPGTSFGLPGELGVPSHERHLPDWCGEAGKPWPDKDQDRGLVMPEQGIFAVFDGVSANENGGLAAQRAADTVETTYQRAEPAVAGRHVSSVVDELKGCCDAATTRIVQEYPGAATTAVVARLVTEAEGDEGKGTYVAWVSVGDSRLYLLRDGELTQITTDEAFGSGLTNALGGHYGGVRRAGAFMARPGDRLLLLTDGITGKGQSDMLNRQEMLEACAGRTAKEAADELLRISRANDDKKVVVVDPQVA
ncbi:MAG TPA: protein phosphatase 2C domain-containing protein [Candidatus Saccharimonadales bacterium]|nr:protein phosphatase 2C domain-containing protein [Candidatus Saccharimonadales bacterium]